MKIRVQRANGEIETITVEAGPWMAEDAVSGGQHRMFNAKGFDHWFTRDGHYDGWGQAFDGAVSMEDAEQMLKDMEIRRTVEPS